jgi:hypothetical protein
MNGFQKGNLSRRAMELGGSWPIAGRARGLEVEGGGSIPPKRPNFGEGSITAEAIKAKSPGACAIDESRGRSGPSPALSEIRLIQAMRKIDPDLAHMIKSLAPVYLVKQ